jgi:hypothetical protein
MKAFLETTVIVDLIFKDRARVAQINSLLDQFESTESSHYVRMEIKRGFLQNLVALYNKSVECTRLSEVHQYIHRLSATPARHRLGTVLGSVTAFIQSIEDKELKDLKKQGKLGDFQKKQLEAFLRLRIRRFWPAFDKAADEIIDPVYCYKYRYNLAPPTFVNGRFDNTFHNCDKYKPGICRLREFVDEHEPEYVQIRDQLLASGVVDAESIKRVQGLKEALRLKKRQIPRKQCWQLGDAILVLEPAPEVNIITSNRKHYEPLCAIIKRPLTTY